MTDEELIARLRVDEPMCEEHFTANAAADRIEALVKERDEAVIKRAAWELEAKTQQARAERLEAALRFYARRGVVSPWVDDEINEDGGDIARAALKGAKP